MRFDEFDGWEQLYRSARVQVSRARHRPTGETVIVKALPEGQANHGAVARLRYEHKILLALEAARARHVPRPMDLMESPGRVALALPDMGGMALAQYAQRHSLDVPDVLHIATCVTQALVDMHRLRVIHKDINPNNIIYNPRTRMVQLVDYDLASLMARELQQVDNLSGLEGTLPYVSPEQTGRLGRALDYRTDFFSLGVTLYEWLARRPPFAGDDLPQVVYAILTQSPPPLPAHVPAVLADMVGRLLEKDPDRRYKSASGLLTDLEECTKQWSSTGAVAHFAIGREDRSEEFHLPQRLYGRAQELERLQAAYRSVTVGTVGFVWITGPSGVGKSALVSALQTAVLEHNGLFATGKYEFLSRQMPFSAMRQAIEGLVRRLLLEPAGTLEKWRVRLQAALGNVGQALVDMAPTLESVVGKQEKLQDLGPQESENRLLMLLQNLFNALSVRQPLVLFLDDLQWADHGTLKWLARLAREAHRGAGMLVVGAYRDDEVDETHPLRRTLQILSAGSYPVHLLPLAPLDVPAMTDLVRDATHTPQAEARAMAALLLAKTAGVPFFVHEFLRSLWERELLTFERDRGGWRWDINKVQNATVTDNVAQMMACKITTLPPDARQILGLAACMGNEFTLHGLMHVSTRSRAVLLACLTEPLALGIIVAVGGVSPYATVETDASDVHYRFAHDQLAQAAYQVMAPEVAQQQHLAVGRYLMASEGSATPLTAASHLNRVVSLLRDEDERLQVAEINCLAGRESRLAAAYEVARDLLSVGLGLLPENAWEVARPLCEGLHAELAQAEAMVGNSAAAQQHLDTLEAHAQTEVERVSLACDRVQLLTVAREPEAAMQAGVRALRSLGFATRLRPTPWMLLRALTQALWAQRGRDVRSLLRDPAVATPLQAATFRLLTITQEAAIIFVNPELFLWCALCGVGWALRQRLPFVQFLSTYGSLCAMFSRYQAARQWHEAAASLASKGPRDGSAVRAEFAANASVHHLHMLPRTLAQSFAVAVTGALERGDMLGAAHAGTAEIFVTLGLSADDCLRLIEQPPPLTAQAREFNAHVHHVLRLGCLCLQGAISELTLDTRYESTLRQFNGPNTSEVQVRGPFSYINTVVACVHRNFLAACISAGSAIDDGIFNVVTDHELLMFCFYASLAGLQRPGGKPSWLPRTVKKLRVAAAAGPTIYGGMATLLDAEHAARRGALLRAQQLYEKTQQQLGQSGYPAFWAAGLECAARFYVATDQSVNAAAHAARARDAYATWGATRKVEMLEREFESVQKGALHTWRPPHAPPAQNPMLDLPTVLTVSQALAGEMAQERLVQKILAALQQNLGATRTMLLLRPEERWVVAGDTQGGVALPPQAALSFVLHTRETLVIDDVAQHPTMKNAFGQEMRPKALLCAPIMHQGRVLGAIYLENHATAGNFGGDRLAWVTLLASQAAVAVENGRLYAHLEDVVARRTEQLRAMHARLIAFERQSTEMQMAGGFAHEVRNALGGTTLALRAVYTPNPRERDGYSMCEVWLKGYDELEQQLRAERPAGEVLEALQQMRANHEQLESALATLHSGLMRALRITAQILTYAQVGRLVVGDENVLLAPVVQTILEELKESMETQRVVCRVAVPADLLVPMKEEHLYTVVPNLIDNALDALRSQRDPARRSLSVVAQDSVEQVHIVVSDTGHGVSAAVQSRMFEPFFTTKGARGTGLGLGLCRKLLRAYGGDIAFTSSRRVGTTFSLHVPRRS